MVNEVTIQWEEDVVRNGYNFTDGCGVMSQDLALEWGNGSSCLQIRLPGVKGVLSASPKLPQRTVILRPSMKKLNVCVPNQGGELVPALSLSRFPLAVIGFSKPSSSGALNAQVLVLLLERGIPEHVLVSKDRQYRNAVKFSTIDIRAAFDLLWLLGHGGLFAKLHEALMRRSSRDIKKCWNQLKSVQQSELSKWTKSPLANAGVDKLEPLRRVFLPLKESRRLYGISDTAGVLDQHSCFVQVSDKSKKRTITGRVLVVRNPCYHEGDVLLLNAVEHESLNHLNDVIVFSVQGDRPHADMSRWVSVLKKKG
ncbi:RNA-dependent RNA polymerase [Obelidium mucronatum]|nr:RNA-dependent RNA polymerase [Obelidium mucronatum]